MNIFGLKISKRSDPVLSREEYWTQALSTDSGISVTPDRAMQHSTVYACVKIIAETLATLPLLTYRKLKSGGKERASDLDIYSILNYTPNKSKMSRVEVVEMLTAHCLLRGNSFAQIIADNVDVLEILPLHTDCFRVAIGKKNQPHYYYRAPGSAQEEEIPANRILHIKGISFDGFLGLSPIAYQRNAIANAVGKEQYESALFKNGVKLSGVLEHPTTLTDQVSKRLAESFASTYGGIQNARKVAVLEDGMKYKEISMTNDEAQFLESRGFSKVQICEIFRVPPYMVGDMAKATFSNIEHLSMDFVVNTIRPWAVRIENAINRDILPLAKKKSTRDEIFCEFLLDGLLRGDTNTRYTAYKTGIAGGFLSPNEARSFENLNPIDGGDRFFIPANNLVPLDRIDDFIDKSQGDLDKVNDTGADAPSVDPEEKAEVVEIEKREDWAEQAEAQADIYALFEPAYNAFLEEERAILSEEKLDKEKSYSKLCGKMRKIFSAATREAMQGVVKRVGDQFKVEFSRADFVDKWVDGYIEEARTRFSEIKVLNSEEKTCYFDKKKSQGRGSDLPVRMAGDMINIIWENSYASKD